MPAMYIPIDIKEKTFIKKYAEGVDPNVGEPFEITEGPDRIYKCQDAINRLVELGQDVTKYLIKED